MDSLLFQRKMAMMPKVGVVATVGKTMASSCQEHASDVARDFILLWK